MKKKKEKEIKKIIDELVKLPEFSFTIKSNKSAAQIIAEDRERY